MAGDIDDLRAAVDVLQVAYDKAREDLHPMFDDPMAVRDHNGRYVLLDSVTALVSARTALANAERDTD